MLAHTLGGRGGVREAWSGNGHLSSARRPRARARARAMPRRADSLRVLVPATPVTVYSGLVLKAHSAVLSEPWVESKT